MVSQPEKPVSILLLPADWKLIVDSLDRFEVFCSDESRFSDMDSTQRLRIYIEETLKRKEITTDVC